MRIDCISAAPTAAHNAKQNFNGLWGESYPTKKVKLYGGEFQIDHYEVPYHPCMDETKEEIKKQILKKQRKLDPLNKADSMCYHGSYTKAVEGGRIPFTKKQLAEIVSDCKEIISGNVPLRALRKALNIR